LDKLLTNNYENYFNKHLPILEKYDHRIISIVEYLCSNGYKLNSKKRLISIFDTQFKSGLKIIIIEKSFFKNNRSLLLELLELDHEIKSIILTIALSSVFRINLLDKKVILR
jgi:hypothetical protein